MSMTSQQTDEQVGPRTTGQGSVVDAITNFIVDAVRQGRYVPGQRLIEADICKRLSVSRAAVREAFQRLTADGLLQVERHRGAIVRSLSREEVTNVFQVRQSLEGLAARLAAPVLSHAPGMILNIHEQVCRAAHRADTDSYVEWNHRFHQTISEAARNPILSDALRRLGNTIFDYRYRINLTKDVMQASVDEHATILRCILEGDAEAAEKAAQRHVELSLQRTLQNRDRYQE
jgi:DNA-binding GntR family transcriptional regulator